jgi:membrane protease YdiL (CAAX protease family)
MHFSCVILDYIGAIIMKSNKIILTIYYGLLAWILQLLIELSVGGIFYLLKIVFDIIVEDTASTIISGILCVLLFFFGIIKRNLPTSITFDNKNSWIHLIIGSTILLVSFNLIFQNTIGLIDLGLGPFKFLIDLVNTLTISDYFVFDVCVFSPIVEEFIYRVFVFKKLQNIYSAKTCIIVSAVIFGFIHLNYSQGIKAFFIGLILGCIYYHTHSFFLVAFLHMVNNTYFLVSALYPSIIYKIKDGFYAPEFFLGLILGAISIFMIWSFVKKHPKESTCTT